MDMAENQNQKVKGSPALEAKIIINLEYRESRSKKSLQCLYDEAIDIPPCESE
jgi:hypothetical protein